MQRGNTADLLFPLALPGKQAAPISNIERSRSNLATDPILADLFKKHIENMEANPR